MEQITTVKEAREYLDFYFTYNIELISYSHELTDNGILMRCHLSLIQDHEVIDIANDAKYDIHCQLYGLI